MKFRHELKHRINLCDMTVLRTRLSAVCRRDEHCEADGTYFVKSLYFDDYSDSALREKVDGISCREKFRIRYYGNDTEYINLEKKCKVNGLCSKEKARITADECQRIISGDTDFMEHSGSPLIKELYVKLQYRLLRPKSIIAYRRESFVYPAGNVRVTLDYEIGRSRDVNSFLKPGLCFARLPDTYILEVKWDEFLPDIVRDAVQVGSRSAGAFSKYAAGRSF